MGADWIKIEKATSRKPEVLQIADILQIHPDHAFGLCVRFWSWCDDQMDSCHMENFTAMYIDRIVEHEGFAWAMHKAGWLTIGAQSIEVVNFDKHLSLAAKKRASARLRKQKQRDLPVSTNGSKPGFVYLASREKDSLVKVGFSRNPRERIKAITQQEACKCEIIDCFEVQDMPVAERMIHKLIEPRRREGEWFDVPPARIAWMCEQFWRRKPK